MSITLSKVRKLLSNSWSFLEWRRFIWQQAKTNNMAKWRSQMKTKRRSPFTHLLQALTAEFSIVWFAAVIAWGENTKTMPIHAPSSGFPVSEFGIIIWFADVRAQVWLKSVQSSTCKCKCTRVRMGPSSSMAALLPLPSLSSERQSSSYFAFVEEAILVHGRDFSVLWLVKCVWGNSFSSI